ANLLDHAEFWQSLLPCDGDREAVAAVGMRV
ncbi:glycosyl transferase, partial [Pseudomonas aeruginosa]